MRKMTPIETTGEIQELPVTEHRLRLAARVSAWLLLAFIFISVISGWGITRTEVIYTASIGLIDRGLANDIHRFIQAPMAATFLTHILLNIRLALTSRLRTLSLPISIVLAFIGMALFMLVLYMEFLA